MKRHFFNADCFDILPRIPAASVDLVLIDPPYGTTAAEWDVDIDWRKLFDNLWRVLKPNGACIIFSQQPVACDVICADRKNFRYEWIWEKPVALGFLLANKMPLRAHENILVFYRELPLYNAEPIASQKRDPYFVPPKKKDTTLYSCRSVAPPQQQHRWESFPPVCREGNGLPHRTPHRQTRRALRNAHPAVYPREGDGAGLFRGRREHLVRGETKRSRLYRHRKG